MTTHAVAATHDGPTEVRRRKKRSAARKGKRVPISYLIFHFLGREASSSKGKSYDVTPHRQNSRPPPTPTISPTRHTHHILTTLRSVFPFHSFKVDATPSSIKAENNNTPNTFSRKTDSHALHMCSPQPPPFYNPHHTIPFFGLDEEEDLGGRHESSVLGLGLAIDLLLITS